MGQPVLRTARLLLEPLADAHRESEVALDADPEVMRFLGDGRPRTRQQVLARHAERLAIAVDAPGLGFWAGSLDGEVVGWWHLKPPQRPDQGPPVGQAELGYRLARRHWRRGLATEGSRELLRYAFTDLGLHRVSAETMAVNVASRATMAGLGMTHVRTFHPAWADPIPGAEQGEVEYAITREAWLAG